MALCLTSSKGIAQIECVNTFLRIYSVKCNTSLSEIYSKVRYQLDSKYFLGTFPMFHDINFQYFVHGWPFGLGHPFGSKCSKTTTTVLTKSEQKPFLESASILKIYEKQSAHPYRKDDISKNRQDGCYDAGRYKCPLK